MEQERPESGYLLDSDKGEPKSGIEETQNTICYVVGKVAIRD